MNIDEIVSRFQRLSTIFPFSEAGRLIKNPYTPHSSPPFLPSSFVRLEESIRFYMETSDPSLIKKYCSLMSIPMIKPPIVAILATEISMERSYPFTIFSHEAIHQNSAFSDVAMMEKHGTYIREALNTSELPPIVKTITVGIGRHGNESYFMVTELGDLRINKQLKKKLSEATGVPNSTMKHHFHINDQGFDPIRNLGLSPGNVGPFPYFIRRLEHIIFLKKEISCELVAIRFTPFDTLIITEALFEMLMIAYMKWKGRQIIFIRIDITNTVPPTA
uniref:Uncharacterized protein n=1 Tax=Candidatus Kentrum eta TaxID=2126337 RepID=A0A450V0Z9_9GAMM|nr:MAG: hypothetical protein BECKH772A_GA0070896_101366 [Candidatus Kentron sp. H]VFJ98504.1 MAG: hypothetical protein BECKH772B_GA0070898_101363 [Candidatus Kentron sp. H]VFK03540.1 MAG: hypothetical protein BECKH772C_GA0070978_101342 [Candidatus Kentron sp. H]